MSTNAQDAAKDVALAALTNLIRLMAAELVAGRHRDDFGLLERAVRDRLAETATPACSSEVAVAGLQLAGRCIEQALAQVRAQSADLGGAAEPEPVEGGEAPKKSLH